MVRRRKTQPLVFVIVALAAVFTGWWQQRQSGPPAYTRPASAPSSRLNAIPATERPQLEQTLQLIAKGGPFPYDKDGVVFQNRENRLPPRPRGYYREYTVPTPGASNRGARRVVQGKDGDTWYSPDHYDTFVRIDE